MIVMFQLVKSIVSRTLPRAFTGECDPCIWNWSLNIARGKNRKKKTIHNIIFLSEARGREEITWLTYAVFTGERPLRHLCTASSGKSSWKTCGSWKEHMKEDFGWVSKNHTAETKNWRHFRWENRTLIRHFVRHPFIPNTKYCIAVLTTNAKLRNHAPQFWVLFWSVCTKLIYLRWS